MSPRAGGAERGGSARVSRPAVFRCAAFVASPITIAEPARRRPSSPRPRCWSSAAARPASRPRSRPRAHGADTMLVERHGALGGLATGGLIILLLTLDDGDGRQVVRGLCQEVTERLAGARRRRSSAGRRMGARRPRRCIERDRRWGLVWGSPPHRVRYSVAYDPEELRFALQRDGDAAPASGSCCTRWACEPIFVERRRARGASAPSRSRASAGRFAIRAQVVIDATGDGDLFAAAGCAHDSEKVLPWLWFRMGGVSDVAKRARRRRLVLPHASATGRCCCRGAPPRRSARQDRRHRSRGPDLRRARVPPAGDAGDRPPARRGAGVRAAPTSARSRATSASPRAAGCAGAYVLAARRHEPRLRRRDRHHRPLDQVRRHATRSRSAALRTRRGRRISSSPDAASRSITARTTPPRRSRRAWRPARPPARPRRSRCGAAPQLAALPVATLRERLRSAGAIVDMPG